jgi:hypothetical protein
MGIDPAYGGSAFGIVVTEWAHGIVQIMRAEEYDRPDYNEMYNEMYNVIHIYVNKNSISLLLMALKNNHV